MNKDKSIIKVVTGKVRFNYVNLLKPKAIVEGAEPRYSVVLLIAKKDKKTLLDIENAIALAIAKGVRTNGAAFDDDARVPLKDGDSEDVTEEVYKNHYYINTTSKYRPGVVDKSLKNIDDENEIYSGCYGRASLVFYPYVSIDGAGVGCGLRNIQKLEDGEALYINTAAQDFEEYM